jgi:GR25 family glycosyltransferase involved in LPS biosynthesis
MTQAGEFPYRGVFINLDRSVARRERMEAELSRFGLGGRYSRLAAIEGAFLPAPLGTLKPGEAGAFLSHARALEGALGGGSALHVLEDDALLSEHVGPVIAEAVASGLFRGFDLLFTDVLLSTHLGMLKALKAVFDQATLPPARLLRLADLKPIDLGRENFSCLTSYVVGPASIAKLLALYRTELAQTQPRPVDLFVRDCVQSGRLKAALLFPFVTSFRLDEIAPSTVAAASDPTRASVMVLAVLRYLFFVGRDLALARACLDRATKESRRPENAHHDMMAQALEFILSSDFQEF